MHVNVTFSFAHIQFLNLWFFHFSENRSILPADNWFVWLTTFGGEGWHNYHHAFPCDYKASEFWGYRNGMGTLFIELCARLGLAYNLKTTSTEVTMKRRQRTGDLSCHIGNWIDTTAHSEEKNLSGT